MMTQNSGGTTMPWGLRNDRGPGSTRQIEDAHNGLDRLGIPPGPLGVRVLHIVGEVDRHRNAEVTECTGLAASWCPLHGSCVCPPATDLPDGEAHTLDDPSCPLHAPASTHAEEAER